MVKSRAWTRGQKGSGLCREVQDAVAAGLPSEGPLTYDDLAHVVEQMQARLILIYIYKEDIYIYPWIILIYIIIYIPSVENDCLQWWDIGFSQF